MSRAVEKARESFDGKIVWIEEMISTTEKVTLYSHARVFCTPSIYEPFGIINLEAMACETPVVGSAVGGMKEIILPEQTGLLVPLKQQTESPFEAIEPETFARDLASQLNRLLEDADLATAFGRAGRERVLAQFSWAEIAKQTLSLYEGLQ